MAYIEKRVNASGKTTYRARIRLQGAPTISETFPTRKEAKEWALKMEAEIRQGRYFGRTESKERTFSELDAILLQQCAGDLCCPMALGGVSKRPDVAGHRLLLKAPIILFSLDVDAAGAIAYRWWRQMYPHMKLSLPPVGKSPGEAHLAGIDLRK